MDLSAIATHIIVGFIGAAGGAGMAYKAVMADVKSLRTSSDSHDKRIEKLEDSRTEFVVGDFCLRMRGECQGRIFAELGEIKESVKTNANCLQSLKEDLIEVIKYQQRVLQKLDIK